MLCTGDVHIHVPVNSADKNIFHQQCMDILHNFLIQLLI